MQSEIAAPAVVVHSTLVVKKMVLEILPHSSSGLVFGESPIKLINVTDSTGLNSAVSPESLVNHYLDSLELPGLTVTNLVDVAQLTALLFQNSNCLCKLLLTNRAPPLIVSDGCHYAHSLPTGPLGMTFTGFPARVETVPEHSALFRKLHPQQPVLSVVVPGMANLTPSSGGFTGARVQEILTQYAHVPGKILTVKERNAVQYTTKSNHYSDAAPFECCTIL